MGSIKVLDKDTINKIAAGEVVERPSSVVKELIENSIDSGAGIITCEIKDGGKSYIRITDDGSGFETDDIKIAFLRHSTSKISSEADLDNIKSLGFRGEALSSISSVSKLELLSKRRDDFLGNRYVIEGGEEKEFSEAGCPDGTTIIVRELFYNTPARRKFLKTTNTETGYVSDIINRLAVSHPEISFRFINQGKTLLFTNGNGSEKDALYSIYGREAASNLIKIDYHSDAFNIEGYIGKPAILRGNRICENYYINGRFSKASVITKSIEEAYKGYAMNHKYPFTSLHFEFPLEKLDINVHPSKMEVRIADGDYYYAKIFQVISDALHSSNLIIDARPDGDHKKTEENIVAEDRSAVREIVSSIPQSFEEKRIENISRNLNIQAFHNVNPVDGSIIEEAPLPAKEVYKQIADIPKPKKEEEFEQLSFAVKEEFINDRNHEKYKIVGQIFGTYWIAELDDNIFLIDQHAAHEKILYERTMKRYREDRMGSQQLFPSLIVTLSLSEIEVLNRYMDYFKKIGFEIEHFGDRDYSITAVPVDLFGFSSEMFFHDMLDQLSDSPVKGEIDAVIDRIATMSCKAAVKGNTRLSTLEAEALIRELLKLENPYHCPHGRPVIITMTKYEIEKKFKRII